jgi:catechol 2,3-dioxygenase-like lactoylglutathione lyase family enzyme
MAMAAPEFFHVGILVADLDAAIERWTTALGMTFAPAMDGEVTIFDPEPHRAVTRASYSKDGPPYIELVQAGGDGHLSLAANGGEGLHHLGLWAPPLEEYVSTPMGRALPPTVSVCAFGDTPSMWHSDRGALNGVSLEMVSDTLRPFLAAMVGG